MSNDRVQFDQLCSFYVNSLYKMEIYSYHIICLYYPIKWHGMSLTHVYDVRNIHLLRKWNSHVTCMHLYPFCLVSSQQTKKHTFSPEVPMHSFLSISFILLRLISVRSLHTDFNENINLLLWAIFFFAKNRACYLIAH